MRAPAINLKKYFSLLIFSQFLIFLLSPFPASASRNSNLQLRGIVHVRGEFSLITPPSSSNRSPDSLSSTVEMAPSSDFLIQAHGMSLIVEARRSNGQMTRRTLLAGERLRRKQLGQVGIQKITLSAP